MNHSVASNSPKTKDNSKTNSLQTRVMLTAAAQIVGHYELWSRIFLRMGVKMDTNLARHLKKKGMEKGNGILKVGKDQAIKTPCSTT